MSSGIMYNKPFAWSKNYEKMVNLEPIFTSGACNTANQAIVWVTHTHHAIRHGRISQENVAADSVTDNGSGGAEGPAALIAFAVSNLVCLAVPTHHQPRVICSLKGHDKKISIVLCLRSDGHVIELLSAGEDGLVCLWRHNQDAPLTEWTLVTEESKLMMHSPVITMASLSTLSGDIIAASNAAGCIRVWFRRPDGNFVVVDEILHPVAQMAHRLYFSLLPKSSSSSAVLSKDIRTDLPVALWVGSVDARIHIWTTTTTKLADATELLLSPLSTHGQSSTISSSGTTPALARVHTHLQSTSSTFQCAGQLSGHQEWVTCLESAMTSKQSLLLASGSQDCKIRIWRIDCVQTLSSTSSSSIAGVGEGVEGDDDMEEEEEEEVDEGGSSINKAPTSKMPKASAAASSRTDEDDVRSAEARLSFTIESAHSDAASLCYSVFLETLLVGHEDWVTAVSFLPRFSLPDTLLDAKHTDEFRLFSVSMDRNMVIWTPDTNTGIWLPTVRVGDIGGMLGGSVGANLLGFVGSCACPSGQDIIGVGYGGSLHYWTKFSETGCLAQPQFNQCDAFLGVIESPQARQHREENEMWRPLPFLTGHFGAVSDCCWSLDGDLLFTVSSDQSCRVFGAVLNEPSPRALNSYWCEISRPLVHGYDLSAVICVPPTRVQSEIQRSSQPQTGLNLASPFLIAIAGDEKIIRVLDAPENVVAGLASLCAIDAARQEMATAPAHGRRIPRAYLPELGLSSKAASLMTDQEQSEMVLSLVLF
jgi:WD40 repeat protein